MKPLFIPLKTEYFYAFKSGDKREELRRYGPKWNEKTCEVGRRVLLSKGYGKHERIGGHITRFKKQHGTMFGSTYKAEIMDIYKTIDLDIACFYILLDVDA